MFSMLKTTAVVTALVAGSLLLPAQAYAEDGCGSDYFKHSDGYLTGDQQWAQSGRSAWIYHSGRVRWCTQDDPLNNDERRRAVIGYPADSYPFESWVIKGSNYRSFCVSQKIRIHMTGIKTSSSWDLGGSASKGGPGVSASYSSSTETITVTVNRDGAKACSADNDVIARTSGITATAQNETGRVDWVELQTTITGTYVVSGTVVGFSHTFAEKDYS
jgi:hypothetical protein